MDEPIASVPPTIAALPFFAAGRYPKDTLLGRCTADGIVPQSGRELVDRVRDVSLGLTDLGMARGERVVLLSESRPDWLVVDFAVLTAGAVTVPIYPTLSVEQVAFIIRDSEATLVVVSTSTQLAKVLGAAADLPALRGAVVIDGAAVPESAPIPVISLEDIAARGHKRIVDGWGVGRAFQEEAKRVKPEDLATIIYTSGTTGTPKGVMLTHGNLVANIAGVVDVLDVTSDDVALSFLPLCHAFERLVAYFYLTRGVSMIFAESIDTVARDLKLVRPTVMTGVPRVFEKLEARILATGREPGGLKAAIFNWAVAVARTRGRLLPEGAAPSPWLRLKSRLADKLVFGKIRDGLGGRLRFAVSGSAPLAARLGEFFYGLGFPVLEGYGLTETAPVLCVMPLERVRFGTVGPPLPNVQLRIAADGEILARGPNIMSGYYKRPRETADAFEDGWFRTGDVGALDEAGYLRITDRKKELIVTSGGKKIAPQPIEAALRSDPCIVEAVVLGENRHFPAALLVPDLGALSKRLSVARPATPDAVKSLLARPDVQAIYQSAVDGVNARLAQFERLKKFAILPRELTMEAGELTPTLKVKRRVVEQHYRDMIEGLYQP